MRILINHLTRMGYPYVCVAGIDTDGSHVRPVLDSAQLGRDLLCSEGGPFALGAVVDLGWAYPRRTLPEVEDVVFFPEQVTPAKLGMLEAVQFAKHIKRVAKSSLKEIFGDDLARKSPTAAAVPKDRGEASLGVLRVDGDADLRLGQSNEKHEIRFAFVDKDLGELALKVTDLRLWKQDHVNPDVSKVEDIRSRLNSCMVAVGLTRYWPASFYPGFGHWLQVNNIFPIDDPLWARE